MNPSRGRLIAAVFQARLADLLTGNSYTTNAGANVLPIGQKDIDPDDDTLPCVVQFPGPVTAPELGVADGLSDGVLVREFTIELVEKVTDPDTWFDQSEDLVRDILQAVMTPSTDPAKNWRSRTLGFKSMALAGTAVEPPPDGVDHLLVSATIAVRYVEHFYSNS